MEQGLIEQRVNGIEQRMQLMEQKLGKLDEVHEMLTRAKGGLRVLVFLGSIAVGTAVIINALVSFANWIRH
jgi:prefoldin subunit 5